MLEWKIFGDVCSVHTGSQLNRDDMIEGGLYPVVNGGKEFSGYTDSYNETANSITISQGGESAGYVNWIQTDFWAGAHCYVVEHDSTLDRRYLYHVLKNKEREIQLSKQGAGIPGLNRNTLNKQIIPIPSLSEQTRIVNILDTFTASIANLKEQIAQRRKQYEYYRDQLLDLEGEEGVEMKTLGEVLISLKTGLNPRNNFVLNAPGSNSFYITVRELGLFEIIPVAKTDKVTDEALRLINNRSNLEEGDVLFSGTGTIGRTALVKEKPTNWNIKEGVYALKPHKEIINSRYLVHLLHTNSIIDKISALIVGDPIRSIPMKSLLTVSIPILSLEDQSRTVSILDTFEASIANLEAQLKEREKQYEYYRNKLLTFE